MSSQVPQKLAAKLKHIRTVEFDYSEAEMAKALGVREADVLAYEKGAKLPSLLTVLAYARSVGVAMDILVDDQMEIRPNTGKW
jgi:DNA-binding XRE family transcriptional regulator